jgi:hypothetical protein
MPSLPNNSNKPNIATNAPGAIVTTSQDHSAEPSDSAFERIERHDTLEPGNYWRALTDIFNGDAPEPGEEDHRSIAVHKGDVHLLMEVAEFDGASHSVVLLGHPRQGRPGRITMLVKDLLEHMEPAPDAIAVREAEQQAVLAEVAEVQADMAQAEVNPMALPGVQEAAKEAVQRFEQESVAKAQAATKSAAERERDLRRIHRRAARRSTSAGNPLTVRHTTLSNDVAALIEGGLNAEGLQELTMEAERRQAVAVATAKYLKERAEQMTRILEKLTPYHAERAQVALAKASRSLKKHQALSESIKSLELYTGAGVEVFEICSGAGAPTGMPLTLCQAKLYMEETLALVLNIHEDFDFNSQELFFEQLATNQTLRDAVFPTERCVVSMAVTRYERRYEGADPLRAAMNNIENLRVFLLVRNGVQIRVVHSGVPSHEAAARLFPRGASPHEPFAGWEASNISIDDLRFPKAAEAFEAERIHYARLLLLLVGLDHREKLFGDFYPPELSMRMLSREFQAKYFRFLSNDDDSRQIGDGMVSVAQWMRERNQALRSGSRVVAFMGQVAGASPAMLRLHASPAPRLRNEVFIASREGKHHFIEVPARDQRGNEFMAKVWLDGPNTKEGEWYLTLDTVDLPTVRRYIASSRQRALSVAYIRLFRRVAERLELEAELQAQLHQKLREAALASQVLEPEEVDEAIRLAIASWRSSHRGAPAPEAEDTKAVHELLTLMYPSDRLAAASQALVAALIDREGYAPLRLVRTGKTQLVLYVQASEEDRAPYGSAAHWGWIKRLVLKPLRKSISVTSSSLVWLEAARPDPKEQVVREWPALQAWVHERPEPAKLRQLQHFMHSMQEAAKLWAPVLASRRPADAPTQLLDADTVQTITVQSREYLRAIGSYSAPTPTLAIPVGAYQAPEGNLRYLYMVTAVPGLVAACAQRTDFEHMVRSAYVQYPSVGKKLLAERFTSPVWRLVQLESPVAGPVLRNTEKYREPEFTKIRSHARGGRTRNETLWHHDEPRKFRRANGPFPGHEVSVYLSMNRALQAMQGLTAAQRRNWYKARNDRYRRWHWDDESRAAESKKAREQRYVPPNVAFALSSLVWDGRTAKPIADARFRRPDSRC